MTRKEAETRRTAWARALMRIARECGKESAVYEALGSIAWGRYEHEPSACDSKENALMGLGFLMGARYVALMAARAKGWDGERALSRIHDSIRTEDQR